MRLASVQASRAITRASALPPILMHSFMKSSSYSCPMDKMHKDGVTRSLVHPCLTTTIKRAAGRRARSDRKRTCARWRELRSLVHSVAVLYWWPGAQARSYRGIARRQVASSGLCPSLATADSLPLSRGQSGVCRRPQVLRYARTCAALRSTADVPVVDLGEEEG